MVKIKINKYQVAKDMVFALKILTWLLILIPLWVAYIFSYFVPYGLPFWIVFFFIVWILSFRQSMRYYSYAKDNVIIFGGRGRGKGMLFQKLAISLRKFLSNIYYGENTIVTEPKTYYNSISPNTALNFLSGKVTAVKKHDDWEGIPYLLDDTALYFPNYNDNVLKTLYPSITLKIPVLRHLYGTYTVFNVQQIERIWKPLRELQDGGYIKALRVRGKSWFWRQLPVLRKYFIVSYRYYEMEQAALNGMLPFNRTGITNDLASKLYMSTAKALQEMYESANGKIFDGWLFVPRKKIKYDTRIYHYVFFGSKFQKQVEKREWLIDIQRSEHNTKKFLSSIFAHSFKPLPSKALRNTKTKDTQ